MKHKLFVFAFFLLLLTFPVLAQETQVGALASYTTSPGTSNTGSWGVTGDAAWRVHPRFAVTGRVSWQSVGKTYRPDSRGVSAGTMGEMRAFLTERIFLSGGAQWGRVAYPDSSVESAYTKHAFNARAGAGWTNDQVSLSYTYLFRDPTTFDTVNGVRVGNRTRGHEIEGTYYAPVSPRINVIARVIYRRLSFIQPYTPAAGILHADVLQFSVGASRVWRR